MEGFVKHDTDRECCGVLSVIRSDDAREMSLLLGRLVRKMFDDAALVFLGIRKAMNTRSAERASRSQIVEEAARNAGER
jgi:hypothetical protein